MFVNRSTASRAASSGKSLSWGDLDLFRMRLGVAARGDHEVVGYP
jgi:hypothetical protein